MCICVCVYGTVRDSMLPSTNHNSVDTQNSLFGGMTTTTVGGKQISIQCCRCSLKTKTNIGCSFPLKTGRHESSVSYFHLIKFLESIMPRTWHGLNPGAETLPGCLFLQTEPGKAWKILSGPESNILTLGSCCWICSYIIKKNSSGVFLGSFAKVLFVAMLAALVISSVVWMMNSGGLILFKKEDLTQHGEIACFAKLHGRMLKSLCTSSCKHCFFPEFLCHFRV